MSGDRAAYSRAVEGDADVIFLLPSVKIPSAWWYMSFVVYMLIWPVASVLSLTKFLDIFPLYIIYSCTRSHAICLFVSILSLLEPW